jgi:hypothetical protein
MVFCLKAGLAGMTDFEQQKERGWSFAVAPF